MDFEKILGDMLSEMKASVRENATEAYALLTQYVENNKEFIEEATTYLKIGEIDLEEFTEIMKDNAKTFESEMLNLEIQKKRAIQDALDAGMKVLLKAADVVV
jgi:vacuolar-type H+-ATPase subunit B/Vma2